MASFWEFLAFTFRAFSTKFQQSVGIYLVFQIFILMAPLCKQIAPSSEMYEANTITGVNAFAYMTLGRMINFFLLPSRSLFHVPAYLIAAAFVALDIVSFAVQLAGGSMSSPTSSVEEQLRAIHIYMGGIGMQEVSIAGFLLLAIGFQREMKKARVTTVDVVAGLKILYTLYISLALITVRIIYRLVEFSSGSTDNNLTAKEAYFYLLEATPMVLAIAVFNIVHPAATIRGPGSDMPSVLAMLRNRARGVQGRPTEGNGKSLMADSEGEEMTRRYHRILED